MCTSINSSIVVTLCNQIKYFATSESIFFAGFNTFEQQSEAIKPTRSIYNSFSEVRVV